MNALQQLTGKLVEGKRFETVSRPVNRWKDSFITVGSNWLPPAPNQPGFDVNTHQGYSKQTAASGVTTYSRIWRYTRLGDKKTFEAFGNQTYISDIANSREWDEFHYQTIPWPMRTGPLLSLDPYSPLWAKFGVHDSDLYSSMYSDGKWRGLHHVRLVSNPPEELVSPRRITYLECKSSRNTPLWFGKQVPKVPLLKLTKSRCGMTRPIVPILKLPYPFRPKHINVPKFDVVRVSYRQRRSNEDASAYILYMQRTLNKANEYADVKRKALTSRYDRLVSDRLKQIYVNDLDNEAYKKLFALRMEKYAKRLAIYNSAMTTDGNLVFSADKTRLSIQPDNPYGFIRLYPKGEVIMREYESGSVPNGHGMRFSLVYKEVQIQDSPEGHAAMLRSLDSTRRIVFAAIEGQLADITGKLTKKLYQKIGDQQIHVGNILAERKQTMDMLTSILKRIVLAVKLKKLVLTSVLTYVKSPKAMANDVLAFKFGLEPLMKDVESLAGMINAPASSQPFIAVRTNYGGTRKEAFSYSSDAFTFNGTIVVSYVVKLSIDSGVSRTLQSFGLVNAAEILWEVTPWSFVVDWLIPVGAWISSHTALVGLSFVTGTRKVKLDGTWTFHGLPDVQRYLVGSTYKPVAPIAGYFEGEMIDRQVLTSLPNNNLLLQMKNPWSWSHGIEAIALLIQRVAGRTKKKLTTVPL